MWRRLNVLHHHKEDYDIYLSTKFEWQEGGVIFSKNILQWMEIQIIANSHSFFANLTSY